MNLENKKTKGHPQTKHEEWEDNDGIGGTLYFNSEYSNLCLVKCEEGMQVAKYDGDGKRWINYAISDFKEVEWWIDLKIRDHS